MVRRFLCFALALLALGLTALQARPARASVSIETYAVTIRPSADQQTAHFTLQLDYRAPGEGKRDGFKYVGDSKPTNLRATAPDGTVLHSKTSYEASSGEHRIDFALPPADGHGIQTVILELDQTLDSSFAWSGRVADIPWVHLFRVPIGKTTVRVVGPLAQEGEGFTCTGQSEGNGEDRVCQRTELAPFPVRAPVGPASVVWIVIWMAFVIAGAAGIATVVARRRATLIATRGVLPPSAAEAYPEVPESYRVPAALPRPDTAQAILSAEDQSTILLRVLTTVFVIALAQFVTARFLVLPYEVGFVLTATLIAMAIPLMIWISSDGGGGWWLATAIVPTLAFLGIVGLHINPLFFIVGGFLVGVVGSFAQRARSGGGGGGGTGTGSSWSTSTCSSGSSCGGGGGGCGGGGGGGGCGG